MEIKNVLDELAKQPAGSFLNLVKFNDNHFGVCNITGVSPVWEMHPDTDEFFYIIQGCFEITLLDDHVPSEHTIEQGSVFVVPKGIWHKPGAPNGCQFMHYTPGVSLHSEADDPRNL